MSNDAALSWKGRQGEAVLALATGINERSNAHLGAQLAIDTTLDISQQFIQQLRLKPQSSISIMKEAQAFFGEIIRLWNERVQIDGAYQHKMHEGAADSDYLPESYDTQLMVSLSVDQWVIYLKVGDGFIVTTSMEDAKDVFPANPAAKPIENPDFSYTSSNTLSTINPSLLASRIKIHKRDSNRIPLIVLLSPSTARSTDQESATSWSIDQLKFLNNRTKRPWRSWIETIPQALKKIKKEPADKLSLAAAWWQSREGLGDDVTPSKDAKETEQQAATASEQAELDPSQAVEQEVVPEDGHGADDLPLESSAPTPAEDKPDGNRSMFDQEALLAAETYHSSEQPTASAGRDESLQLDMPPHVTDSEENSLNDEVEVQPPDEDPAVEQAVSAESREGEPKIYTLEPHQVISSSTEQPDENESPNQEPADIAEPQLREKIREASERIKEAYPQLRETVEEALAAIEHSMATPKTNVMVTIEDEVVQSLLKHLEPATPEQIKNLFATDRTPVVQMLWQL